MFLSFKAFLYIDYVSACPLCKVVHLAPEPVVNASLTLKMFLCNLTLAAGVPGVGNCCQYYICV